MAKKKETKVVVTCNKCGNKMEVEIPEHEQFALGIAVGKDSGLGEVELPTVGGKKEDKTQKQLEALKKAGIDTSRFFAMGGKLFEPSGDGTIHEVHSDNPTVKKILEGRYLYNSHLFKQHVLAQLFKALTETRYMRGRGPVHEMEKTREGEYYTLDGYQTAWKQFAFKNEMEQWRILNDELKRQSAMSRHGDMESLAQDSRWYNKALAVKMFEHYIAEINWLLDEAKWHNHRKHGFYIHFKCDSWFNGYHKDSCHGMLYVNEFDKLRSILTIHLNKLKQAKSTIDLHHVVEVIYGRMCPAYICQSRLNARMEDAKEFTPLKAFENAYKGYGGYFGMQNLIQFHGCRFRKYKPNGRYSIMTLEESMAHLESLANENIHEGYKMLGAFKQLLRDCNFDIAGKQKEWYEAKHK